METNAVTVFLKAGGQITKLKSPIAITETELLDYLRANGFEARYADENFNGYRCHGKRVNLYVLLRLANDHRRTRGLPPLTIRPAV